MKKKLMMLSFVLIVGACSKSDDGETNKPCPPQSIMIDGEARDINTAHFVRDFDGNNALMLSCSLTDDNIFDYFYDRIDNTENIDDDYSVMICARKSLFNIDIDLTNPDIVSNNNNDICAYIIDANEMLYGFSCSDEGMEIFYLVDFPKHDDDYETTIVSGKLKSSVSGDIVTVELDATFEDGRSFSVRYNGTPVAEPR